MKNVLVTVHDDQGQESRLQCAFDAVRALDGHLYCLDVFDFPIVVAEEYSGFSSGIMFVEETEQRSANRQKVVKRLAIEGLPFDWIEDNGDFAASIERSSGLIDLIVVNTTPFERAGSDLHLPARLAREQDIPLLAVPASAMSFDPRGPALVAWDGSRSANQALQAALPLLRMAATVTLLSVTEHGALADATAAAKYLSRHDIAADVRIIESPTLPVSTYLLDEIEMLGASLCVMGAYDHAPLRERLFGGTTERLLKHSQVPLLLAHED
ncbi:MAG: universal stress protein [Sphingomonadales bacterium]|nr:universal stress protein [Sphingomonadales bacterium]